MAVMQLLPELVGVPVPKVSLSNIMLAAGPIDAIGAVLPADVVANVNPGAKRQLVGVPETTMTLKLPVVESVQDEHDASGSTTTGPNDASPLTRIVNTLAPPAAGDVLT